MNLYPTINKKYNTDIYLYCFNELDGNNIYCEVSKKNGCIKFGSRKVLIDETSLLGESINIIKSKYEKDLVDILKKERIEKADFYFEYFGPNSFAGQHDKSDVKDCVLFDASFDKNGTILEAKHFFKIFGSLHIPNLIHQGKINEEFVNNVYDSNIEGMAFEGLVCKGQIDKKTKCPIMFKIKTKAWLDRLREFCKGDVSKFSELE